ncbi:hypothetical protein HaLaN_22781, partial [Haematococcus lacustris]
MLFRKSLRLASCDVQAIHATSTLAPCASLAEHAELAASTLQPWMTDPSGCARCAAWRRDPGSGA